IASLSRLPQLINRGMNHYFRTRKYVATHPTVQFQPTHWMSLPPLLQFQPINERGTKNGRRYAFSRSDKWVGVTTNRPATVGPRPSCRASQIDPGHQPFCYWCCCVFHARRWENLQIER